MGKDCGAAAGGRAEQHSDEAEVDEVGSREGQGEQRPITSTRILS